MKKIEQIVDLDKKPSERWHFLTNYKSEINELLSQYLNDFSEDEIISEGVNIYKNDIIPTEYLEEIEFIASISDFSANDVLVANLYYDVLKFYFGCTAFAVETTKGILHARNLDWFSENNILSKYSMIFDFRKNDRTIFKIVGWPGFIGALSGIKPNAFSITLNAVLSEDEPIIAFPISFLIRDTLAETSNFQEAKKRLEKIRISSDCLLLLSGIKTNEYVVVERTPTRFATRVSNGKFIIVTNDYKLLQNNLESGNVLQDTSCSRYDQSENLLTKVNLENSNSCLSILKDENVMMGITMQQMVFNNVTGEILFEKPYN